MSHSLSALNIAQGSLERVSTKEEDQLPARFSFSAATLRWTKVVARHLKHHVGVGIICSVAYFDPGNWSVDLQAGSQFGYRPMLFVLLMASLGAMILQSLSFRLGCVNGIDLASHCRLLLYDRPKYRYVVRYMVLYPLYALCEVAIMSTDLAELLGSAIGLCLLFPKLPLWAGVLVTASDVLIFLMIGDPSRGRRRSVKAFELTVIVLVFSVLACFIVLLIRVKPDWPMVFLGFVPSSKLFDTHPDALYAAVGILGATVMPHGLFLGSFLATQNRVNVTPSSLPSHAHTSNSVRSIPQKFRAWFRSLFEVSRLERKAALREYQDKTGRENNDLAFVSGHLTHGLVDVVVSLLALAVPINSAILVIAATVFHGKMTSSADLFAAYTLIKDHVGTAAAFLFAIALVASGQSASITATLAGQVVSEGFIEWRISPFLRRIVTRMLGLVPSVVVAIAVGRPGLNVLLVASQVVLSIVLPFVAFPLIYLTSSKTVMRVRKGASNRLVGASEYPAQAGGRTQEIGSTDFPVAAQDFVDGQQDTEGGEKQRVLDADDALACDNDGFIDYSNGRITTVVASILFLIILGANICAIVMLGTGRT